jgi:SAM-dependent methyltransferase
MVRECRSRFPGVDIRLGDARDLTAFPSGSFDLVLFSYNGLDCLDASDRPLALEEIRRVLRRGGHFAYSFHNLNFLPELYKMNWSWSPVGMLENVTSWVNMRRLNGKVEADTPYLSVRDGSAQFRAVYYYARPAHELEAMRKLGFQSIRVFRAAEGAELTQPDLWPSLTDPWIYLLCTL